MPRGGKRLAVAIAASEALVQLDALVAAVRGQGQGESKFKRALETLETLARKEAIPIAIVGGLGAIHHGYERFTKDIDVVVARRNLDSIVRVAPKYGIKVIWQDPAGWHKLNCHGVDIDVVPEGSAPEPRAPTTIPGPKQLGVQKGTGYASLAGWVETKLGSNRIQDRADVVQVMKKTGRDKLAKVRDAIAKVDSVYLRRFDELHAAAEAEKEREAERGRPR